MNSVIFLGFSKIILGGSFENVACGPIQVGVRLVRRVAVTSIVSLRPHRVYLVVAVVINNS